MYFETAAFIKLDEPMIIELHCAAQTSSGNKYVQLIREHLASLSIEATMNCVETGHAEPAYLRIDNEIFPLEAPPAGRERDLSEVMRFRLARAAGLKTILFVCTGNAVRSQIAEAIVNSVFSGRWAAFSGGTMPLDIHKDVVKVMKEIDIDLSAKHAKHVDLFRDCAFDKVVILCSDAGSRCPDFPGAMSKDYMNFDDPLFSGVLAGGILPGNKWRIRSMRDEIRKAVIAYLESRE
jgi:arsenate reductase